MSIFGTIMSKVFGHGGAPASPASPGPQAASTGAGGQGTGSAPPAVPSQPGADTGAMSTSTATPAAGGQQAGGLKVDVAAVLDGMAGHAGQTLNWRESIVDLLKLLGMDSSLSARKELAHELHYTGSTEDSASMNIWLHKEVMMKFAENGGKLPDDLKHA